MSEIFGKKSPNLFVPDQYKKQTIPQQPRQIRFEDIPEKDKEIVKCKCGHTLFEPALQHFKINIEGQIIYANKPVSVCKKCGTILPDKP